MKRFVFFLSMCVLLAGASEHANAQCFLECKLTEDLVTNGDFANGNDGSFNSNLNFTSTPPGGCGNNSYAVTTNSNFMCNHATWHNITGNGNYMVIDGAINTPSTVWSQVVNVVAGRSYIFSYSVHPELSDASINDRPILEMRVNGVSINTVNAATLNAAWNDICQIYVANITGPVLLEIRQLTDNNGAGDDFGLDNISFLGCRTSDPCEYDSEILFTRDRCKVDFQLSHNIAFPVQVVSIDWTFGDGYSGSGQAVTHYYSSAEPLYNVCVRIVTLNPATGECCVRTQCIQLEVEECEDCNFGETDFSFNLNACCEYEFNTTGNSPSEIIGWYWDFGDGSSGTGKEVEHVFPGPGIYNVCLTLVGPAPDGTCCTREICREVNVECTGTSQGKMQDPGTGRSSSGLHDLPGGPENGLIFYPNPATEKITIEFNQQKAGFVSIEIYDGSGRRVQTLMNSEKAEPGLQQRTFDFNLKPGAYLVRFEQNGRREVHKLIVR